MDAKEINNKKRFFTSTASWIILTILSSVIGIVVTNNQLLNTVLDSEVQTIKDIKINNESELQTLNKKGEILWEKDLSTKINKYVVDDINEDNKKDLIIGFGESGKTPGHILALNQIGEKLWENQTYPNPFPLKAGNSGKFKITQLFVEDLNNDGKKEIVILAEDPEWFVSRILILNAQGKEIGSFLHPGRLTQLYLFKDMLAEGSTAIVGVGVNNDLRQIFIESKDSAYHGVIFLLDASNVFGQAPPYFGQLQKGSHKWYRVIFPQGRSITSVDWEANSKQLKIAIDDGRFFYLDASGKIVNRGRGDKWTEFMDRGEEFDTFYEEDNYSRTR